MTPTPAILALVWQPALPPPHIFAGAAVLAALAVAVYARHFRQRPVASLALLGMRLGVVAALALLLMGPSYLPPTTRSDARPRLTMLLDTSASMLTEDCPGGSRLRFAANQWLNSDRLTALAAEYDLRLVGFDDGLHPLTPAALGRPDAQVATGQATKLGDAVASALSDLPGGSDGSALLVLSDGHDSQDRPVSPAALLAKSRGIPLYTTCLGQPAEQRDVAVVASPAQEFLLVKEPGQVMVTVYQTGYDRATATVRLRLRDAPGVAAGAAPATPDEVRRVEFGDQRTATATFTVRQEQAGQYEYVVSADPLPGEADTANNSQSVFMQVTGKRIKVLLVEGQPYWETKFLAQSLRKDERIELTQVTQMSDSKRATIGTRVEGQVQMPRTGEELARYDVVILGGQVERVLDAQTAPLLVDFVAQAGGHLIFARGRGYDEQSTAGRALARELSGLEPVVWGRGVLHGLSLALTPQGRASPPFAFTGGGPIDQALARLPGFSVMPAVEREKASAMVLARALPRAAAQGVAAEAGVPAMVRMTYGRGTVVAVLGEGLWRWSMLPPNLKDLDGLYDTFWSNLVRWLAMSGNFEPGDEMSIALDHTNLALGESLTVNVPCKIDPGAEAPPRLTVTDPGGQAREAALRRLPGREVRYQTTLEPGGAGVFRVKLESAKLRPAVQERRFSVVDVNLERINSAADAASMRVLAEQSAGQYLAPDQPSELPRQLQRQRQALVVPRQPEFLWDRPLFLVLLLVWAGAEWLARRKAGMI